MKLVIENTLLASFSFLICLLTRGPNCKNNNKGEEEFNNIISDVATIVPRAKFPVFWNVPTFQCHKYGLNFSRVSSAWGIEQNPSDEFRGDIISILYDPGEFPALLEAPPLGNVPRNGGVPQEGSLSQHLRHFKAHLDKLIPWPDFKGLGVLDFEHWRPIWHQNWGTLNIYRQYSRHIERRRHPFWFYSMLETEAVYRYELAAKMFMLETIKAAKQLRPEAKWGYYGYPFCFNFTPNNNRESCSDEVVTDNDSMEWLFSETTAYYPSLYLKERDMGTLSRRRFVRGRLKEAWRVAKGTPIYPYVWYKYHDSNEFLSPADMLHVLGAPRDKGCSGVVIWGASKDVNTEAKCIALANYLENVIGPAIAQVNSGVELPPIEEDIATTMANTEEPKTTERIPNNFTVQTTTPEENELSEQETEQEEEIYGGEDDKEDEDEEDEYEDGSFRVNAQTQNPFTSSPNAFTTLPTNDINSISNYEYNIIVK